MNSFSISLAMVENDDTYFEEDFKQGDDEVDSVLEDLNWRVVKLKLEEENTKRFLKSKPRYLPYSECRKWVSAWSRWSSEDEWRDWIDMGEKRNSYIPARPDEYYGELGQWKSWDHFLGLCADDDEETTSEFE